MDFAALALNIDSSSVVKATADLEKFATASNRARSAASGGGTSNTAKMAQDYARAAETAGQYANAAARAAAANDNVTRSAAASASSVIRFGDGYDVLTGKMSTNLAAINRNIAGLTNHRKALNDNAASTFAASNAAAQFQDIAITAGMGMSPWTIALQQGTQLAATMQGGIKSLGAAVLQLISPMSLLAIGLTAAIALLIQWGMEALNSADKTSKLSKALDDTKLTTYAFSDAQNALGGVIDLTTGKIKTQSAALYGLARAQLEVIRATALKDQAEASKTIAGQRGLNTPTIGRAAPGSSLTGIGLSGATTANETQRILDQFTAGKLTPTQAIDGLEKLKTTAGLTEDAFIKLTGAIANFGVAGENLKVYAEARKALEGDQGALQQFLTPDKPRRGGKTDADRFADIVEGAQNAIAAERARAQAVGMTAEAAAALEQKQSMLNAANSAGIKLTDGMRAKIDELAASFGAAKAAADTSVFLRDLQDAADLDTDKLRMAAQDVGLYGRELAYATKMSELLVAAKSRDIVVTEEMIQTFKGIANEYADTSQALAKAQFAESMRRDAEATMFALDRERGALGLTREAAIQYGYVTERLIAAKRQNIELSPDEVAAIEAAGAAYAKQAYAIDQHRRALEDAREVTRGFFADWINGVREGGNIFKAFADSVVNSLNRIIDKLLDRTLDTFLDGMFQGGSGGGFLGGLLGGNQSSGFAPPQGKSPWEIINSPNKFARGGAFTNSIVSAPTLFRFANGAALGEMGEAGPEAIMPLKRGPNGALGVQAHGGGSKKAHIEIKQDFHMTGVMTPDDVAGMVRQGAAAAVQEVKRNLDSYLREWDIDGAVSA